MWIKAGVLGTVAAAGMASVATVAPQSLTASPAGGPVIAKVFATREGLVGELTANGHVITERDHFAALPSRRGLAAKGGGDRTVRVCRSGRCVFLPVWDVGPWNTTDDYWNADRQSGRGLPVGMPAAQAAFQDGYNGGRDEFGRAVQNPAGIDIADGAFWDGLKLTDNSWVDVTFLWTGSIGPYATVATQSGPLMIRKSPSASAPEVGFAAKSARIPVQCQARGQAVGSTDLWDRLGPGMYVSHAFVATPAGFTVPVCDAPLPSLAPATKILPTASPSPLATPVVTPVAGASPTPGPAPSSP
ncbi:hypothetical protein F4553_004046 [Allocatelliglobosispora scoriae]|uniref:Uncharacterized protein n=1 Tax=Allocatelliglobosispora scoriae TaxID=643052 RepID=A0A841BNK2_9ACTN|nr:hypothetical protein [Allocatelliglobosispora scoriae]MBB5870667.1 hypothetical protein [Allocatelliglobosispora scoriae]